MFNVTLPLNPVVDVHPPKLAVSEAIVNAYPTVAEVADKALLAPLNVEPSDNVPE